MRRPYSAAWRAFRATWKELLLFVLFFQALTFVLLAPAGSWVLARLVSAGGSAVVSNEELAAFFLSPLGVLVACVVGIGFLALELTGLGGLIRIASGRGTAYAALRRIVRDAPKVLALAAWQIGIGFLCLLPFLAAGLVAFLLLVGDQDINYFIVKKPPSFWGLATIVGALALGALSVAALLRVRWALAIPLFLFESVGARASLSASRRRNASSRSSDRITPPRGRP